MYLPLSSENYLPVISFFLTLAKFTLYQLKMELQPRSRKISALNSGSFVSQQLDNVLALKDVKKKSVKLKE